MQFYAKLTGNRRDIHFSPKALLTDIIGIDRTHCWTKLTPELEAIQPRGHHKPIYISFEAKLTSYLKQGQYQQETFTNITNIKRINKYEFNQRMTNENT